MYPWALQMCSRICTKSIPNVDMLAVNHYSSYDKVYSHQTIFSNLSNSAFPYCESPLYFDFLPVALPVCSRRYDMIYMPNLIPQT